MRNIFFYLKKMKEKEKDNLETIDISTDISEITDINTTSKKYQIEIWPYPHSFSANIFINIKPEKLNEIKCKYCDQIPVKPRVFKLINNDFSPKDKNKELLCNDCFNRLKYEKKLNMKKIYDQYDSNNLKLIINKYEVICPNIKCNWQGVFFQLLSHLTEECEYQSIKCISKECRAIILRKDLYSHLEHCIFVIKNHYTMCIYCGQEIKKDFVNEHLEECSDILVNCENNCGKKIKKKDIIIHKSICPEANIKCKYWEFGCNANFKKKDEKEHEMSQMFSHLDLIKIKLNSFLEKNDEYNKILKIYNKLQKEINIIKKEEEDNKNREKLIAEIKKDPQGYKWKKIEKKYENKLFSKNILYTDYVPYTGKSKVFISNQETHRNKIIFIENDDDVIKYSGNYSKYYENDKHYFLFDKDVLPLNKFTNFEFRIQTVDETLPWIAFGIYIGDKNYNDIENFPKGGYYCIDLENNTYYNGEVDKACDSLNFSNLILVSYLPKDRVMIISDKTDSEIIFPNIPNDNPNIRFCFIFKGKYRAIIRYDS